MLAWMRDVKDDKEKANTSKKGTFSACIWISTVIQPPTHRYSIMLGYGVAFPNFVFYECFLLDYVNNSGGVVTQPV
uniref:Transmembrane protein n=1 Tax=Steinernema glaseri TaxID=37863 RepID=A0A1I8AJZ8_9BILA